MGQVLQAGATESISFCIHGLAPKEETLFKSFVRLVAHRTNQRWVPSEPGSAGDVWIVPAGTDVAVPGGTLKLQVGDSPGDGEHALHLPFRADELEQCLNRLGSLAITRRGGGLNGPIPLPPRMRLVRWPGVKFTRTPERMRLATLLTAGHLSLAQLHLRSGVPLPACEEFAQELFREGLLAHDEPETRTRAQAATVRPTMQDGLLAQIRNRLRRITR